MLAEQAAHHRAGRLDHMAHRIRMVAVEHNHRRSSLVVHSHRAAVPADRAVLKNRTKWVDWVAAAAVVVDCLAVLLKRQNKMQCARVQND